MANSLLRASPCSGIGDDVVAVHSRDPGDHLGDVVVACERVVSTGGGDWRYGRGMAFPDRLEALHQTKRILDQAVRGTGVDRSSDFVELGDYAGSLVVTLSLLRELVLELHGRVLEPGEHASTQGSTDGTIDPGVARKAVEEIAVDLARAVSKSQELHVLLGVLSGRPSSGKIVESL